ncbi:DUF6261 family protein [Chryseobacterium indoltheticum]|uniref:Uncharacterized protein n=1 Tax=Chryseobacterium indoltheticum TaxID=254 RepID=A0A381FLS1_9FLAO|nr:DUF6261 family protein [Chryseobacterium indoltheticum]SUX47152.1 Uncharacterised protein [Chryseobacterium indoltheticum]
MNTIELKLLRNAEYLQYVKDYLSLINLNSPEQLGIEAKLTVFTSKISEVEALYKKAMASEATQEILMLDERRDDAITGIGYFLQSQTYHYETEKQQKAQLLLNNMALYGSSIARQNYQSETATLNNLLRDWENKPELMDAINSFSLSSWVAEMKTANEEFNAKYLSRTQEYGDANPETIKTKREEINTAYYQLRDRIDALHLLVETPPSPYEKLINQLNALTDQYNKLLISRTDTSTETPENPQI